ncbi:MAG: DNA primase, partial [Opitutales bacterium]
FFKCFSSGEAGDAISFIQKVENLDFQEAVEYIANRFNIPIRYEENVGSAPAQPASHRKALFKIHEFAATWYRERFLDDEEGAFIRKYWTDERGFSLEIAEEFGIGYAPPDSSALLRLFADKGIPQEVLDKSGLFFERKGRPDFFPRFRGRLMIPIRDTQARIVAFTARQLSVTPENDPARGAKYVNSPETPIFSKGNLLFNLDKARRHIGENERFLLVEGQLDAMRCWEEGAKTVVAPQGTAFTDGQGYLMRRYRPAGVDCLLDGDDAGRKAALRMLPIFVKAGIDTRFLMLAPGGDPDELLRAEGLAALGNLREEALGGIAFAISMYLGETTNPTPTQKNAILEHIFTVIAEADSLVARDEYLAQAIRLLKLEERSARHELSRYLRRRGNSAYRSEQPSSSNQFTENGSGKLTTVEDDLLLLLLHHDEVAVPLAQVVEPEWLDLTSPAGRVLAKALAEIREEAWNGSASLDDLLEQDDERNETYAILAQTSSHEESESAVQACNACLQALFLRYLKHREDGIRERFANSDPGGTEQLKHLRDELADLRSNRTVPPTLNFSPSPASEIHSAHVNDQNQNSQGASQNEEENSCQDITLQEEGEQENGSRKIDETRCQENSNESKGNGEQENSYFAQKDDRKEDLF